MEKHEIIQGCTRIVVKVNLADFTYDSGKMNYTRMENLTRILSNLMHEGKEVIVVGTGAIEMGMHKLKRKEYPVTIREKQAVAAVGQCEMMRIYNKLFAEQNCVVGQVLLTKGVMNDSHIRQNIASTFEFLLESKIIPIVDENDTVTMDQVKNTVCFGSNHHLLATVKDLVGADVVLETADIAHL